MHLLAYRDVTAKSTALANVVDQLPVEHYETLRLLMMHLHGCVLLPLVESLS